MAEAETQVEPLIEPMLVEDDDPFVPVIRRQDIWNHYKIQQDVHWVAEEIDFSQDVKDWKVMQEEVKRTVKHVLSFFLIADMLVAKNIDQNLSSIKWHEVDTCYTFQKMMENVHSETYRLMMDTLVTDKKEREELNKTTSTYPSVQLKVKWALKWIHAKATLAEILVAFSIVEGIMFSSSFCVIFWLRRIGLMPGLSQANKLIARDEGQHVEFAFLLYNNYIVNKLSIERITEMVSSAVEVEKEFVNEAIKDDFTGMTKKLMIDYVCFVADRHLVKLGAPKKYNVTNPFEWMDLIAVKGKANFFEKRVTDYTKASQSKNVYRGDEVESEEDDF